MRPLKHGEKFISISTRVPESVAEAFKSMTSKFLKKYEIADETEKNPVQEVKDLASTKPKWLEISIQE